jgi:WD40 repeat protein
VQFSADGRRLFTAGYPSGVLQFWDVDSGKELRRIDTPAGLRGSSDYTALTADWSTVYVPREKRSVVRFEADGQKDWRVEYSGEVLAFDAVTGRSLPSLEPGTGRAPIRAHVSPDGRTLIVTEQPSHGRGKRLPFQAVIWDMATRTARPLGEGYAMAVFTADSKRCALTLSDYASQSAVLKLLRADGTELAEIAAVEGEVFASPILSADGRRLAVHQSKGMINQPGTIRAWEIETRQELASIKTGGDYPFRMFTFFPDGRQIAATDYNGGVRVWDAASGRVEFEQSLTDLQLSDLAFLPGGRLAVFGQPKWDRKEFSDPDALDLPQPRVYLFDLTNVSAAPEIVICPHGYLGGLAISPDGRTMAVGGAGATHLFDMTNQQRE